MCLDRQTVHSQQDNAQMSSLILHLLENIKLSLDKNTGLYIHLNSFRKLTSITLSSSYQSKIYIK